MLKFPKPKDKHNGIVETGKDADAGSEADLQKKVESYIKLCGLRYIHIPGNLQNYLRNRAPAHIAKLASVAFKGMPDLVIFGAGSDGIGVKCLLIELKSKTGALSQGQKSWHKGLTVHIVRSLSTAKHLIDNYF